MIKIELFDEESMKDKAKDVYYHAAYSSKELSYVKGAFMQAQKDQEILDTIISNNKAQSVIIEELVAVLNAMAAWHDGPTVNSSFDSPSTAQLARETLAAIDQKLKSLGVKNEKISEAI